MNPMFRLPDGRNPERVFLEYALVGFSLEMALDERRKWRVGDEKQQTSADIAESKCLELQDKYRESQRSFRQTTGKQALKDAAGLCGMLAYWKHYVLSQENEPKQGWSTPVAAALYAQACMEAIKLEILDEYWRLTKDL
jgi:hypothetical protein